MEEKLTKRGAADEAKLLTCCCGFWGAIVFVFAAFGALSYVLVGLPAVGGLGGVEDWARTFPYLSIAHHFETALFPSPPPPAAPVFGRA